MTETMMRKRFKKVLKDTGVSFDQIETGITQLGYPDIHFCADPSISGWMELKHVPSFKSGRVLIPWRPGQLTRGKMFVIANINLWLCLLADDTHIIRFIPGYNWAGNYSRVGLNGVTSYTFNIGRISFRELMRVLGKDQYA